MANDSSSNIIKNTSLITLATDPELYNQFAAPMMENVREILQEETQQFMNELVSQAGYPIEQVIITSGELSEHVLHTCRTQGVDLVICEIGSVV